MIFIKIVVLAGGLSDERDVSLTSGSLVANTLMENGHEVCFLDLYVGVDNFNSTLFQKNKKIKFQVNKEKPDLKALMAANNNRNDYIGPNVITTCKEADIVFICLHGSVGENGKLQALFDLYNIKYTGSNYLGSAIAMDKSLAKHILESHDILVPKGWVLRNGDLNIENASFPLVVKPSSNGSSIGVFIVNNIEELKKALEKAYCYDNVILVEEFVSGREFSVGIMNDLVLPPIEIKPKSGFYDYENKYQAGLTEEICPANISKDEEELLKKATINVFKALQLNAYARIDFIMDNFGKIYCLEANTLPGMTPTSLLPQEALAMGISYSELCEKIINLK